MITLGIHNGHDAAACLMRDGELVAFCKEERLTRVKNDGKRFDLAAIDEVLRIGRVARRDLDAVCFTRKKFPFHVYRRMPLHKRMRHAARRFNGRNRDITLEGEMSHRRLLAADRILDMAALRATLGLSDACLIEIVNHDYAHILGAFRYTDWPAEALYLSCDGGGDGTQYSAYHFNAGRLELLIGGDNCVFRQPQNPGASVEKVPQRAQVGKGRHDRPVGVDAELCCQLLCPQRFAERSQPRHLALMPVLPETEVFRGVGTSDWRGVYSPMCC